MTKSASTLKQPRKQHTPEFRNEALKLAERIGVAAASREFNLYESQFYAWCSKLKNAHFSSEREQDMSVITEALARCSTGHLVFYEDEVDIDLNPKIGADWQKKASKNVSLQPGKNEKHYLAGVLHAGTGRVDYVSGTRKNSD